MSFVLTITRCGSHDAEGKQFRKWSDAYNAAIIVRKAFSDDIPDKSRRTQWSGNGDTACWQGLGPDGQVRLIHIDPYSTGEPNPIKVVENNMELFNPPAQSNGIKMTQRDKMRELYHQHHGDKEAVIEAYAEAEQSGEVNRQRNASRYGTEQYAQALWSDGEKKAGSYKINLASQAGKFWINLLHCLSANRCLLQTYKKRLVIRQRLKRLTANS